MEQKLSIPLWHSSAVKGNYVSIALTDDLIDMIKEAKGKKLLIRALKPESIKKQNSPVAYIDVLG